MKFLIYLDIKGKYRWRLKDVNGQIIGASTQGYVRRIDCKENAERVGAHLRNFT